MRESKSIKVISIISSTIINFFLSILLLFIVLFITLQNGIDIDDLSIPNAKFKKLSIKWNNNIDISIKSLEIIENEKSSKKIDLKEISKYFKHIDVLLSFFNSINIDALKYKNFQTSLKFNQQNGYILELNSSIFDLNSKIDLTNSEILIDIKKFKYKKEDISLKGNVLIKNNLEIYSQLFLDIYNDANLTIYLKSNDKNLFYDIRSDKKIKNIKHIIDMIHLPSSIYYWAYKAIDMKNIDIIKCYGFIDFNDIKNSFKKIYIKAIVNNLKYTYNKNLDSIDTKYTILEFKNGFFNIYPKKAYTYGFYLNKSWLNIDFNKNNFLLKIYLKLQAKLDKNILKILHTYQIDLPFLQKKGSVDTNLILEIGLKDIDVKAYGDFYTKKANFDYLGLNIDIKDTHINLKNYDVTIDKMKASLRDMAKADVKVKFDTKKLTGKIDFNFNHISLVGASLTKPLKATYYITKYGDFIDAKNSHWIYHDYNISLEKIYTKLNTKNITLKLPATPFKIENISSGFISGDIDISNYIFDLDIDILKLHFNNLKLSQSNTHLKAIYNKELKITSSESIYFTIKDIPSKISNLNLDFKKENIYLNHTKLLLNNFLKTDIYMRYNTNKKNAYINLSEFLLTLKDETIYKNKNIILNLQYFNNQIKIKNKDLDINFTKQKEKWSFYLNSLRKITKKSPILQKYNLNDGKILIYSTKQSKNIFFKLDTNYPYPFLQKNNEDVKNYHINGYIKENNEIIMNINNKINIVKNDKIDIKIHDTTLNIDNIFKIINNTEKTNSNKNTKSQNILLNCSDTSLYLGYNRYVLSDNIYLQYFNNILTAQLKYKNGEAGLRYEDDKFHLYGSNFNDKFMNKLLSLSKFIGGSLDFSLNGRTKDYDAIFFIKKTTLKEYALINNILAFINTVPSLVTFSIPDYNTNGLYVKQAYMNMHLKNDDFNISDIYLDSKELKIIGKGKANIKKNMIDLKLNLKTDLASDISKIPLVGYILFNGDSISTTLKVYGKLTNPTIKSLIAEDIVVAPFNIIKRTLILPYKIIKDTTEMFN